MEPSRRMSDYWAECMQDTRYILRTRTDINPAFTAVAVLPVFPLVLALCGGLQRCQYTVAPSVALSCSHNSLSGSLPARASTPKCASRASYRATRSPPIAVPRARITESFQAVSAYQTFYNSLQYKLTGTGEPRQLDVVEVADNFFPTLGIQPALGRNFTEEECLKGGRSAALLSYFYWKTQLASDPAIIGKVLTINNSPVTVVGVLPANFDFGAFFAPGKKVDLFVPAVMDFWKTWGNTLAIVGRLKPGVTEAQAQDEADRLFPRLKQLHQDWYYDYASDLTTLKDHVAGRLRRSLVVLWSAVGLILLIVCVNLSNLQLSRAATRSKEFAMRSTLGAGRGRLIRQLLTESLILSLAGSALGLAFAFAIVYYLAHQSAITLPLLATIHVDAASLAWTLLIAISVGILFGLAPA